jgi:hypothetical protein
MNKNTVNMVFPVMWKHTIFASEKKGDGTPE